MSRDREGWSRFWVWLAIVVGPLLLVSLLSGQELQLAQRAHALLSALHSDTTASGPTDDRLIVGNGTAWEAKAVPNCGESGTLNYDSSTNTFSCLTDSGGGGGGNFVEVEVDFTAAGKELASTVVTDQSWVTTGSEILCTPTLFATADRLDAEEDAAIEGLTIAVSTRVAGTGFTVWANPKFGNAVGKFIVNCTGT